ncbi:hypothetical protein NQZ68_035397 [Dissostichus eleginoides]|nr:hypothetical protein NQZ68_035397 [Dissostichus eleginoides]
MACPRTYCSTGVDCTIVDVVGGGSREERQRGVERLTVLFDLERITHFCCDFKQQTAPCTEYDYIGEEEQSRTTSSASTSCTSNPTEHTPTRPIRQTEQTPTRGQTPTPSASSTLQRVVLGKRKRGGEDLAQQERLLAQQKEHQEQNLAQHNEDRAQLEQHFNQTLREARDARELEAALRREENAQVETFNLAFLRTLGQMLGGMGSRRAPSPPPL